MKKMAAVIRIILCLLCCSSIVKANCSDSIPAQSSGIYQRPDQLFLHIDKHIYSNNEFIWFSAWLLQAGADSTPLHNLLCVMLVPSDTRIPTAHKKFLMAQGFSYGSLKVPDTIAPGEYKLVAYTNIIGKDSLPLAVFSQDITIHSVSEPDFIGAATILDNGNGKKELLVTVREKGNNIPARGAELLFWCGNNKMVNAKTDKDGVCKQPLSELITGKPASPVVNVKITYKSGFQFLQKVLYEENKERKLVIQFYPEGGKLLSGVPARIGWRSATDQGEPVAVKAVVYKNQQSIDTIVTNEWGMGAFLLQPEAGVQYSIKVLALPAGIQVSTPVYALPPVLAKGMALTMRQAVAGDSLMMQLFSAGYSTIRMRVHDFKTVFIEKDFPVRDLHTKVLLLLDSVPKGIAAVTLLDENDKRLAERIFFAHYDYQTHVDIRSDRPVYAKRQKVTLTLQLRGVQPTQPGVATISCVQGNRVLNDRLQDIESFSLLEAPLQNGLLLNRRYSNSTWMENVLLVNEGRKWNTQPDFFSPVFTGHVVSDGGKIKKPLTVSILGNQSGASAVTTDARGQFQLKYDELLVLQDRRLVITANSKSNSYNRVIIHDPFEAISNKLAGTLDFRTVDAGKYVQYAYNLFAKDFSQAKQLAAVTVTASLHRKGSLYGFGSNLCGDYVCKYNVLNCSNHPAEPDNRPPVKGQTYNTPGRGQTIYWGCVREEMHDQPRVLEYEGIKIGNLFQSEDYSVKTSASPEYISTLYFSPTLVFDANGKAECSFYTSDITGSFHIVVNGMTGNNFFYGMFTIVVK